VCNYTVRFAEHVLCLNLHMHVQQKAHLLET
jgi:hypothetical protein